MVTQNDIVNLNALFITSCEIHGWKSKGRYFHLTSVENFIFYLPQIKDEDEKEFAYQTIYEYLTLINKVEPTNDLESSKSSELFKKYLDPLCNTYKTNFSFTYYIQNFYFFCFFLLVELIFFLLKASAWIHILILSLLATNFIYKLYMKSQKKNYGLYV